jgi:S-adenosylmethionine decarboxylase
MPFASGEATDVPDEEFVPGCFEGPEKTLQVIFKIGVGPENGCKLLHRASLDKICTAARCTILSEITSTHTNAYVLSESSLFVSSHKIMLKTCGRTTLLQCLQELLELTVNVGLEVDWIGYSRKNYTFPKDQRFPHRSHDEEFEFLTHHPGLVGRQGSGHILGSATSDNVLVYLTERDKLPHGIPLERTFNMMMFDLDESVTQYFFKESCPTLEEMMSKSGMDSLSSGTTVDAHAFDPCGFSMNTLLGSTYSTVHVTPERECSYSSYETNAPLESYTSLINKVLSIFRPGRVVISLITNHAGLGEVLVDPFSSALILVPDAGTFCQGTCSTSKIHGDFVAMMATWERRREVLSKESIV